MHTPSLRRTAAVLLAAGGLLSSGAHAGILNYSFSVTPDSGPVANQTFTGSFAFDDGTIVPGGGANGEDVFALTSFSFSFGGTTTVLTDLLEARAARIGNLFVGLEATRDTDPMFSFVPGDGTVPADFFYTLAGNDGAGSVVFSRVPEPSTAWLLASAALGVGALRLPRKPQA